MNSESATPDGADQLLERSRELASLGDWLRAVDPKSGGRLVVTAGEAGAGKTALLRRFAEAAGDGVRLLWGSCDSLFTPQPFGPFHDIAEATRGELDEAIASGAKPHAVATALLRELAGPRTTLVVIEDLHWADEASLDVLGVVARRIRSVPALVVGSYRDDGLDRNHPLRVTLGELATVDRVSRIIVPPLSSNAVAELAARRGVDADALYRTTGGNAFFVTEVLATEDDAIPATVRDAVLARTARLSGEAQQLLEALAIIPPPVEAALVSALAPNADDQLDECLAAGVLTTVPGGIAFRHELARLAVAESLPPRRLRAFHAQALAELGDGRAAGVESARLAHHAEGAADADAVLRFAPEAAVEAAAAGAHREAAAQYARALRFASDSALAVRADLLERRSAECTLIGEFTEAIAVGREALECWRSLGAPREEGRALQALAWPMWNLGDPRGAEQAALGAVSLLDQLEPGPELTAAYLALATIMWGAASFDAAVEWGEKALELATRLDDRAAAVEARVRIGAAKLWRDQPNDRGELDEALELARRDGVATAAGYAYVFLAGFSVRADMLGVADAYTRAGIEFCSQHDLDSFRPHLVALRAELDLAHGRWTEAAASADAVLARRGVGAATRSALVTLGLVRARRADPAVWEPLDEAMRLARPSGEAWRIGRVAVARAEASWLEGRFDAVIDETEYARELGGGTAEPWALAQLAVWRERAGAEERISTSVQPYAMQLAGDWRGAAEHWRKLGCPYEAALALGDADDDDALRQALDELQAMGATPAAAIVARRLRSRGVRGVPRGPRPGTRTNPANLTARQLEILALVAEGLRNAEIAARLFVTQKTVAHHVSAILSKLDVHTRGEAAAVAVRLGLTAENR